MNDFSPMFNSQNELKQLWHLVFGDSNIIIDEFFRLKYSPENTLVKYDNDVLASMLYLLPAKLDISGESYNAHYIYAAATREDYRSKGYMAQLVNQAIEKAKDEDLDFLVLYPAQESLYDYYAKFGFSKGFIEKKVVLTKYALKVLASKNIEEIPLNADNMLDIRKDALKNSNALQWDIQTLKYFLTSCEVSGRKTICASNAQSGLSAYVVYEQHESFIEIIEALSKDGSFSDIAALLLKEDNVDEFIFHFPLDFKLSADRMEVLPAGMIMPLNALTELKIKNAKNLYLGLNLD